MASQNNRNSGAKKVAVCGLMIALAFIFSYIESLLPLSVGIPGVKLGLANLVILSCLYILPKSEVFLILITRILLSGFLFGNGFAIIYSLAGGILSFVVMLLMKGTEKFSEVGVSICGGTTHNLGQLLVAVIIVENQKLLYYFPVLLVAGALTGGMIGIITQKCRKVIGSRIN